MRRFRLRRTLRRLYGKKSGIEWVFHAPAGQPCPACLVLSIHEPPCGCGHCPVPVTEVIHKSLSERMKELGL